MNEPYCRVYWSVMDDPKFDGIRDDVKLLGSWTLLLLVADMAYPAPAFTPPTVPKAAFAKLVACGLIDDVGGHRYRVHGLRMEREKRSDSARNAAALRWQSGRNAETMPSRAEQSKDETSIAREVPDGRKDLEAWMLVRGFNPPSPRQRAFLDGYVRTFDLTGPERAERLILSNPDDPIAALKKDLDAFRAERREAAIAEEPRKPKPRKSSGLTGVNAELAALYSAKYAEEGKA